MEHVPNIRIMIKSQRPSWLDRLLSWVCVISNPFIERRLSSPRRPKRL